MHISNYYNIDVLKYKHIQIINNIYYPLEIIIIN